MLNGLSEDAVKVEITGPVAHIAAATNKQSKSNDYNAQRLKLKHQNHYTGLVVCDCGGAFDLFQGNFVNKWKPLNFAKETSWNLSGIKCYLRQMTEWKG